MAIRRDVLISVLPFADDSREDVAAGGPDVPSGWTSESQSGGWYRLRAQDGELIAVCYLNTTQGGSGLWAFCAHRSVIRRLNGSADLVRSIQWLWAARGNSDVLAVLRRLPDWRCDGTWHRTTDEGTDDVPFTDRVVSLLQGDGDVLPDPTQDSFPWALGRYTVTGVTLPALNRRIAGWDDHTAAEDTPEDA